MFMDEPRLCMGLNPNHRRVIKYSREDEEERYAAFADAADRKMSVAELDRRWSIRRASLGGDSEKA